MANRSSNRAAIPEAKSALDRFKYEVASEIGVPLKDGYNGDLTSRQNGSVGGYMVKKMIEQQEKQMAEKSQAKKNRLQKRSASDRKAVQKLSCTVKRTQEMKKRKALGIDPGAFFC